LEKLTEIGDKLGFRGVKLIEFVMERESMLRMSKKEKMEREERAVEPEAKRV